MRLAQAYPQIEIRWVVLAGEDPGRVEEARRSAEIFLAGIGASEIAIYGFRDGFLPFQGELVKEASRTSRGTSTRTSSSRTMTMITTRTTGLYRN